MQPTNVSINFRSPARVRMLIIENTFRRRDRSSCPNYAWPRNYRCYRSSTKQTAPRSRDRRFVYRRESCRHLSRIYAIAKRQFMEHINYILSDVQNSVLNNS